MRGWVSALPTCHPASSQRCFLKALMRGGWAGGGMMLDHRVGGMLRVGR